MSKPRIGVVISTTRDNRFGAKPAQWILGLATARTDMTFELVDLRDYPMPFFAEAMSPAYVPATDEVARRWAARMAELDGYVFVTAEYNHGIPGELKNALDHVFSEVSHKPAAFVGYGGVGAARAVEQLRLVLVEQRVAPLRDAVHIGLAEFMGILQQGKTFDDYPYLAKSAEGMFEELGWWAPVLKAGREGTAQAGAVA
jgi:NAD(P)H-dependent FMN reductase